MNAFTQYRRKQIAELRPWQDGDDMSKISVSGADFAAGSPKAGDMIARNPKNHADQRLVAAAYFADNFEPIGTLATQSDLPVVDIQTMKLTDGRADHFVRITVEDRSVTPHMFRDKYKSEYHVQLYSWLFTGIGEEPDVMDFSEDEWPARTLSPQEQVAELLEEARSEIVLAIAFLGRDLHSDRLVNTANQLANRLAAVDAKIRAAQGK